MAWVTFLVSSLAIVSLASAQCQSPSWVEYPNKHVSGGMRESSGDASVADCQNVCLLLIDCLAVDYTDSGTCWLTTNPDTPITDDTTSTHYQAQRVCTTTTQRTSVQSTCTYSAGGAFEFDTGNKYTRTGLASIDDCSELCTLSTSCTAFAWDPVNNNCIQTLEPVDTKVVSTSYTLLVKDGDCVQTGICTTFHGTLYENSHAGGGTRAVAGDESLLACGGECYYAANGGCIGLDITASGDCYIHTDPDAAITPDTGTVHYRLMVNCTGGTNECVFSTLGNNIPTNVSRTLTGSTFETCVETCIADASCTGFAYNATVDAGTCFITNDTTLDKSTDTDYLMYGRQSCSEDVATTESTTTTSTLAPTTAEPTLYSCEAPSWETFPDKHISGGTRAAAGDASVAACQAECLTRLDCFGVDYTDGGNCWLNTNVDTPITDDSTSTHYQAKRVCTTEIVTCTYKSYGAYTFAGTIYTQDGAATVDACASLCTIGVCTAFAWNPVSQVCVITTDSLADKVPDPEFTMLAKDGNCSGVCTTFTARKFPDSHAADGIRTSAGDESVLACGGQCALLGGACVGLDYTSSGECYLHTNPDSVVTSDTGTLHTETLRECTAGTNICTFKYLGNNVPTADLTTTTGIIFEDCVQSCINDTMCTGFASSLDGTCHLASDAGLAKSSNSSFFMYQKESCTEDVIVTTEATTTTTEATTTTAVPTNDLYSCEAPSWVTYDDQHVSGGTRAGAGDANVAACQAECLTRLDCLGADYTSSGTCWLTTNPDTPITDDSSSDHYRAQRVCTTETLTCTYESYGSYTFNGAIFTVNNAVTVADCASLCNILPCTAFAWDPANQICVRTNDPVDTKVADSDFTMLAKTGDCTGVCGQYYSEIFEDSVAADGTRAPDGDGSIFACQAQCAMLGGACVAISYTSSGECYTTFNPDSAVNGETGTQLLKTLRDCTLGTNICTFRYLGNNKPTATLSTTPGIGLDACVESCIADNTCRAYAYNPTLDSGTCLLTTDTSVAKTQDADYIMFQRQTCTEDPATQPPTTATTTTTVTTVTTVVTDGCLVVWDTRADTSSGNGVRGPGINTLEGCQDACVADDTCVGLDFTGSNQCWFHYDTADFDDARSSTGVMQYILVDRCQGVCIPTWEDTPDRSSGNGDRDTSSNTLAMCQQACLDNTDCVALDFTPSNQCWLHYDLADLDDARDSTGVVQWKLVDRCTGSISTESTTTVSTESTTTVSTESTTPTGTTTPGCTVVWDDIADRSSGGAVRDTSANTLEACQAVCVNDDTCVAVDFVAASNQCWVHNDVSNLDDERSSAGVTQWRLVDRCFMVSTPSTAPGCTVVWDDIADRSSGGAARDTSANTLEACQAVCVNDNTCVAVDFVAASKQCWVHNDISNLDDERSSAGVTQWQLVDRCFIEGTPTTTPECTVVWDDIADRSSGGGVRDTSANTLESCQAVCVDDDTCVAVDFVAASNQCWVHNDASHLVDERPSSGVTQWRLVDRCAGVCAPIWETRPDTSSGGAALEGSLTTLEDCQNACVEDDTCVAVDYIVASNQCWMHDTADDLDDQRATVGIVQYVLLSRCTASTTPTTAPECTVVWDDIADRSSGGGVLDTSVSTLEDCQAICVDDDTCVAVDFVSASNQCWVHNDVGHLDDERPSTGVTQWRLVDRCAGVCVTTWDIIMDTHGQGGTFQNDIITLEDCRQGCIDDGDCIALDYTSNTGNFPCWWFFDTDYTTEAEPGTDHNVLVPCTSSTPTSTGGSTTTPGCTNDWERFDATSSQGGTFRGEFTTEEDCLDGCIDEDMCVGIDLDNNRCWFHMDIANFNQVVNSPGVTQFRLTRCVTGPTPSGPTPSGGPVCGEPIWETSLNSNAQGGMNKADYTTKELCLQGCVEDTTCLAVDVNLNTGNPPLCWFHTDPTRFNVTSSASNVEHHILVDRCPPVSSCPRFEKYENKHAFNGIARSSAGTLEACKTACVTNMDCAGIDFNDEVSGTKCYLHTSRQAPDNLADDPDTDHYDLVCRSGQTPPTPSQGSTTRGTTTRPGTGGTSTTPSGCTESFVETSDAHGQGGIEQVDITSLQDCQDTCINSPTCTALDWDGVCWLFFTTDYPMEELDNVNHYKIQRCDEVTSTVVPTGATSGSTGGTTRQATSGSTAPACPTFTVENDVHGNGGVEVVVGGPFTMESCTAVCVDNADCLAVDFAGNQCWIFTTAGYTKEDLSGVDHYVISRCSTATGTAPASTTPACPTFLVENNVHGQGGTQQSGSFTLDSCQDVCVDNTACLAIDFSGNQCWIFTSAGYMKEDLMGVDHYVISRCSVPGASTTPQAATSPAATSPAGTTPSASSAPPCSSQWSFVGNTHALGGINQPNSVNTVALCQAACMADSNCFALDFVTTGANPCWLILVETFTTESQSGTNHYVQTRC